MERILEKVEQRIAKINREKNELQKDIANCIAVTHRSGLGVLPMELQKQYGNTTFLTMYPKEGTKDLGFLFSVQICRESVLDMEKLKEKLRGELLEKEIVFMESEEKGKLYFDFFVRGVSKGYCKKELEWIFLDFPDYDCNKRLEYSLALYERLKKVGKNECYISKMNEDDLLRIFNSMIYKEKFSLFCSDMDIDKLSKLYVFIADKMGAVFQETMLDDSLNIIIGKKLPNWEQTFFAKEHIILDKEYAEVRKAVEKKCYKNDYIGYKKITDTFCHFGYANTIDKIFAVNQTYHTHYWNEIRGRIIGEMSNIYDKYWFYYSDKIGDLQNLTNYISTIIVSDKRTQNSIFGKDIVEEKKREVANEIRKTFSSKLFVAEDDTFTPIFLSGKKITTCIVFSSPNRKLFGISKINLLKLSLEEIMKRFSTN